MFTLATKRDLFFLSPSLWPFLGLGSDHQTGRCRDVRALSCLWGIGNFVPLVSSVWSPLLVILCHSVSELRLTALPLMALFMNERVGHLPRSPLCPQNRPPGRPPGLGETGEPERVLWGGRDRDAPPAGAAPAPSQSAERRAGDRASLHPVCEEAGAQG